MEIGATKLVNDIKADKKIDVADRSKLQELTKEILKDGKVDKKEAEALKKLFTDDKTGKAIKFAADDPVRKDVEELFDMIGFNADLKELKKEDISNLLTGMLSTCKTGDLSELQDKVMNFVQSNNSFSPKQKDTIKFEIEKRTDELQNADPESRTKIFAEIIAKSC